MMRNIRRFSILFFLVAAFSAHVEARSLQQIQNYGTIRVGIALATPWAMRDKDGELMGFDIDVAKQLAAALHVDAEFLIYDWDRLIGAIETDEIDIIVAGLTITPERALHVNFSNPYSSGGLTLATNLTSTSRVETLQDLNDSNYSLALLPGSVAQNLAAKLLPRISVVEFESAEAASEALIDGEVDAYLEEEPVPSFLALDHPSTIDVPIGRPLLETRTGFAVAKGDADFVFFLNAWIVGHESDTWLPTTHNYWFSSLRWRNRLGNIPDF